MRWEHAFVGGGIAASSLVLRLTRDGCGPILVVEPHEHDPRTFAFWSDRPLGIEPLVEHRWTSLRIDTAAGVIQRALGRWRYQMVRGEALREQARRAVEAAGGRVLRGYVDRVEEGPDHATLVVGAERHEARWVYDSRAPERPAARGGLVQSFTGWWVETSEDAFDATVATLMDFRTAQDAEGIRFFHVLPVSARRALVTGVTIAAEAREIDVGAYLGGALGLRSWRHVGTERGVTPLTDQRYLRRAGEHILAIGIAGGQLKPSTGYAFARMQEDADRIAASLRHHGHPFDVAPSGWVWRLLDAVLLRVIAGRGPATELIFVALFHRNPIDRVLRFLDQRAALGDVLRLVWSLPRWRWFLAALVRRDAIESQG